MSAHPSSPGSSSLKRALSAIERLQAKLDAAERAHREPIAVVGMGCRFPGGSSDPAAFWRLLRDGVDAVTEVPPDRWDVDAYFDPDPDTPGKISSRWGGFLERVDTFDAPLFGITPREAEGMDPQQRLVLEVCWAALENAGIAPDGLVGSRTGVFLGIVNSDYAQLSLERLGPERLGAYYASGAAHSIASGRLSYVLGLKGPSLSLDTACSSSLVAVHLACRSLRSGECRMALAAGVNVILVPETSIALSKYRMLSSDGRCKTFDAHADGFARGEGCGVLVLKRAADAVADGDRIVALIRGTATNQDGASSGLTAPNGPSQEAVMLEALEDAGIAPADVTFLEAHGTGTSLGDPIEVQALGALGSGRPPERPLLIGSVKTNFGHLEAAAGIAGLIKAILALRHGEIPPSLHLEEPNPLIPWDRLPIAVATERTPWPPGAPRVAGVSSFGFSGTNAHVVVSAPDSIEPADSPDAASAAATAADRPLDVLTLTAMDAPALQSAAVRFASYLEAHPSESLADVAHTANVGRARLPQRLALVHDSAAGAKDALAAFASGEAAPGLVTGRVPPGDPPKLAFLFTGQGSQRAGMARELYECSPVFREALERCDALLGPHLDVALLELIHPPAGADGEERIDRTEYTQPALFSIEWALAELWRSWGVTPAVVLGHSIGELVAACVAGVLELEDALRLVAERGRLMGALPAGGAMAAVFAAPDVVEAAIEACPDDLAVAAYNGPEHVVISGRQNALEAALADLESRGVRFRRLRVSHAFHSPLMEPMLSEFAAAAGAAELRAPGLPVVSNVTGLVAREELDRAEYWRDHVRRPVRFEQSIRTLRDLGVTALLEVGPAPTLLAMAQRVLAGDDIAVSAASLRPGRNDWESILNAVAALHVAGVPVDWGAFDRPYSRRRLELPTYPFAQDRFWIPDAGVAPAARRTGRSVHPLVGRRLRSALAEVQYEAELGAASFDFIRDHRVRGTPFLPAAAFLEMALGAAADAFSAAPVDGGLAIEEVTLLEALPFPGDTSRAVQTILARNGDDGAGASFRILAQAGDDEPWRLHATGRLARGPAASTMASADVAAIRDRCGEVISAAAHQEQLRNHGLDFGPALLTVHELRRGGGEALARIQLPRADGAATASAFHVEPALLDGCLQAVAAVLPAAPGGEPYLPLAIGSYRVYRRPGNTVLAHAVLRGRPGTAGGTAAPSAGTTHVADVRVLDESGAVLAEVAGLTLRPAAGLPGAVGPETYEDWLYRLEWMPAPRLSRPADEELLAAHRDLLPRLEILAADFIEEAFLRLGWTADVGERVTTGALANAWGVAERHARLLGRLLAIVAEEGMLEPDRGHGATGALEGAGAGTHGNRAWRVLRPPRTADAETRWRELLERHPASEAQIRLVGECGRRLDALLTGAEDPLALLFPNGSPELAERLYSESPAGRLYNALVAEAARVLAAHHSRSRPLRVLEIGAGTGATTAAVLPTLPADTAEYVFTDISPLFLARAAERFSAYRFVRCETLDIERDPASQGFANGRYDLVLAVNVLHATAELDATLEHVRELVADDGALLLVEGTGPERWIDITFGLTEGWWRFTDVDRRGDYPLLPAADWVRLLSSRGFADATALPGPAGLTDQAVILAGRAELGPPRGSWLVIGDAGGLASHVAARLEARGHRCVLADAAGVADVDPAGDANPLDPSLQEAHADPDLPLRGVLYLGGLEAPDLPDAGSPEPAQRMACSPFLHTVQALGRAAAQPPRLWVATRGARGVGAASPLSLAQAGLWGMAQVVRLEHPEFRCVSVDLETGTDEAAQAAALVDELLRPDGEDHVAIRDGIRHVARLRPVPRPEAVADAVVALEPSADGVLEELAWRPAARRPPGPGEVEIRVHATGLNFRDVMNAVRMRSDTDPLGAECSGRILALGPGVRDLAVGDEIVAITAGGFASHVTTGADLVARRPGNLDAARAAGATMAYLTALYSLHHLAGLKAGERVLIHAAAGGVGLAAVHLARRAGAEVFATAGSPEKREFLRDFGIAHVYDSRSLDFAGEVLAATGDAGVDVVLNSLAGDFIAASLECLARDGRFVEIGKRDIWTTAQVAGVRPEASYHPVDLAARLGTEPAALRSLFLEVVSAIEDGGLPPLPVQRFPAAEVADAFRFMAQAKHVGKIVVLQDGGASPLAPTMRPDGSYLITGGLSGLGLLVARWFVDRGARHVALLGRGAPKPAAEEAIRSMEAAGARIQVLRGDVSVAADVDAAIAAIEAEGPVLRGVVHSVGVLEDRAILRQDWDGFARVLKPKVDGAWYLHRSTRDRPLDFFVLFSSTAGLLGSAGQANHAAANAFLDTLAHHRRALGLPAHSINWGVWADVGAAAERGVAGRVAHLGIREIPPDEGLGALGASLARDLVQVAVARVDWGAFLGGMDRVPPWLAELAPVAPATAEMAASDATAAGARPAGTAAAAAGDGAASDATAGTDLARRLAAVPPNQRLDTLLQHVHERVVRVIGSSGVRAIDPRQPLSDLGVDSLMAVELRNLLARDCGAGQSLPATLVFDYPTIAALTDYLAREVLRLDLLENGGRDDPRGDRPSGDAPDTGDLLDRIESLSDEEIDRIFAGESDT